MTDVFILISDTFNERRVNSQMDINTEMFQTDFTSCFVNSNENMTFMTFRDEHFSSTDFKITSSNAESVDDLVFYAHQLDSNENKMCSVKQAVILFRRSRISSRHIDFLLFAFFFFLESIYYFKEKKNEINIYLLLFFANTLFSLRVR